MSGVITHVRGSPVLSSKYTFISIALFFFPHKIIDPRSHMSHGSLAFCLQSSVLILVTLIKVIALTSRFLVTNDSRRFSPRQEFSSQGRQQQQPTRSLEVKGTLIYDGRARKLARRHPAASPHRRGKAIVALSGTATSGASGAATKSRRKARVTVRRAKEADYAGVAGIRSVIIPVGMSGATGFLGGKVVIDDPAEAERRLLLSKVTQSSR